MIIKVNKLWFFPKWVDAVAFWPFIFMKDPTDLELVRHEKVHLKQQLRGLLVFFYLKYLYYNWKYGYWDNPYEVEARGE